MPRNTSLVKVFTFLEQEGACFHYTEVAMEKVARLCKYLLRNLHHVSQFHFGLNESAAFVVLRGEGCPAAGAGRPGGSLDQFFLHFKVH